MKKIIAFAVRNDELDAFKIYSEKLGFEVTLKKENLSPKTVNFCKDFDGVSFLGNCTVDKEVLEKLHSFGIKYIASRSTGYNNVDLTSAKEFNIFVSNSTYSPNSVAEFTVLSALMLLRNIKKTLSNIENHNFSLAGLMGREIRNQTIGVIGTGKIGRLVVSFFKAMGAKVIAYDLFKSENIDYVSFEELLEKSDIITLHSPLTKENYHMINRETISLMKEGVIIINGARGELIDLNDLLSGLKSKKIGGAFLDTFENEFGIVHTDCSKTGFNNPQLDELLKLDNVIVTSHQAFYTDQAVSDMVESSLTCLHDFFTTGNSTNNLIK